MLNAPNKNVIEERHLYVSLYFCYSQTICLLLPFMSYLECKASVNNIVSVSTSLSQFS